MGKRSEKTAVGRLTWYSSGYAFVDVEGLDEGIYVTGKDLGGAMNGDTVKVHYWPSRKGFRGRVVDVLESGPCTVIGRYVRRKGFGIVTPYTDMPYTIIVPKGWEGGAEDGATVSVEVKRPGRGCRVDAVTARVRSPVFFPHSVGDDLRYVSARYALSWSFPPDAQREASEAAERIDMEAEAARRVDLRERILFTIDGVDARDFDDAIGIEEMEGGKVLLTVAIADVSHVVPPGGPLDKEARRRGFSVYFPEACIPMLPEVLSSDAMSLKPQQDRLAVCVEIVFDRGGNLVTSTVFEALIRSRARLTYEEVGPFLEGTAPGRPFEEDVAGRLLGLHWLAQRLYDKRRSRGSLDFDLAGMEISLGLDGAVLGIGRTTQNAAHRVVEECMLMANRTVCAFLKGHGLPALFRVHEPPDARDILELAETLAEIGFSPSLVSRLEKASAPGSEVRSVLQEIVDRARGTPIEGFVNTHVLRALKRARYSARDVGHFGLAFDGYVHFTSPIRRYPDLVVHRMVKSVLSGASAPKKRDGIRGLERLAREMSDLEETTDSAMREALRLKAASYMATRLGEVFDAVVTSVRPFGAFVELLDPPVEGMVRIWDAAGHAPRRSSRGRGGIRPGEVIRVCLARADTSSGRLDFVIAPDRGSEPSAGAVRSSTAQGKRVITRRSPRRGGRGKGP